MAPKPSSLRPNSPLPLLAFVGLAALAAYAGARMTGNRQRSWQRLASRVSQPPNTRLMAPLWSGLLVLTAFSGHRVWKQPPSPDRTRALALWGTQLALSANWWRLFFGERKARAALADLLALSATLGAYVLQTREMDRTASRLMAPAIGWVTFAGYLNEELIRKKQRLLN